MMTACSHLVSLRVIGNDVAQQLQQRQQLIVTAVDIADDVERAVFVAFVGPQRPALDDDTFDVLDRAEDVNVAEAFAAQVTERALQVLDVAAYDVRAEGAVGPLLVATMTEVGR